MNILGKPGWKAAGWYRQD